MIELTRGNLLEADVDAVVNTVNCVGVMGKGIALQFKQAFPANFREYAGACRRGEVRPGSMFVTETGSLHGPQYIINFPTKRHWRGDSRIEDIESGLEALIPTIQRLGIRSVAVPPLGCGSGGLDWADVRPLIESALSQLPDVRALVYEPDEAPEPEAMPVSTSKPSMTRARASLLLLLELYREPGYRLTILEVQKLAYLLQRTGEPMNLEYVKHKFGPYAETLNFVLQRLEGHHTRGYGDRSRRAEIRVLPGAVEEAEKFVGSDDELRERLEHVARLIEGFETPYGMELLTSVDWVAVHDPEAAAHATKAVEALYRWNTRKRSLFKEAHVRTAWQRLHGNGWLGDGSEPDSASPANR